MVDILFLIFVEGHIPSRFDRLLLGLNLLCDFDFIFDLEGAALLPEQVCPTQIKHDAAFDLLFVERVSNV